MFTQEPTDEIPSIDSKTNATTNNINIPSEIIKKKILALDINKACGPDEIHPKLLKELANKVATPLSIIFKKSLQDSSVSYDWRNAQYLQYSRKAHGILLLTIDRLA